jgi:hypothetical protein
VVSALLILRFCFRIWAVCVSMGSSVVPDAGGHRQQALRDPGVHAVRGACAVPFQVELSVEGLVDRFDPLADATEVAVAVGLVLAVRAQQARCHRLGEFCEVLSGETLVGQQDLTLTDEVVVVVEQRGQHLAFADLGVG